jgi:glycosyltransferase involved in cell wall biosynthesis
MKILIINWRSVKDPLAGGAEKTTFEHCKRWVKKHKAEVTWLSSKYNKNITSEEIEGVKFEYIGSFLNRDKIPLILISFPIFYFLVIYNYFKKYRGKINLVIEEIHGIPYLTPLYIKEPVIVYIHEIAGEIWDKMFNFPINIIGKNIEKFFLKFYQNVNFITASKSSEKDLISIGIKKKKIYIVEHGISLKPVKSITKKYSSFTLVFLNRMVKMKGPERALEIFAKFLQKFPDSKLLMLGDGEEEYVSSLKKLSIKLNIEKNIEFKGFVSEEDKIEILQKSHALINTSYKEGWGLVNLEANSQGTPAIVFDVEGCKDSVKDGINGYISDTEKSFIENIEKVMKKDLSKSSLEYSKKFNYDIKSEDFWKIVSS